MFLRFLAEHWGFRGRDSPDEKGRRRRMIQSPRSRLAVPQSPEQHLSTRRKNQKGQSPGFCSGFAVPIPQPQNQQGLYGAPTREPQRADTESCSLQGGKDRKPQGQAPNPQTQGFVQSNIRAALQGHTGSLTPTRPAFQPPGRLCTSPPAPSPPHRSQSLRTGS